MLSQVVFPSFLPLPSRQLPLTLISLEDWILVKVTGIDTIKYLQGQLTCDIASLTVNQLSFAAHCNAKGRMLSFLYVFHHHNGLAFITRRSVHNRQLAELKKYAIFAKITITADHDAVLLGVAGFQTLAALNKIFTDVPDVAHPVVHHQETTLLYFHLPTPRILLITTPVICNYIQQKLEDQLQLNNSQQWLALDIEAGYPVIDHANSTLFIPQAANLQALNGISFKKGCYLGQEIVARAQYRGVNKRALYWLAGKASYLPVAGDSLELKIGDNWRQTGTVLAACQLINSCVWVQAIINNALAPNSILRISKDNSGELFVQLLPYNIV